MTDRAQPASWDAVLLGMAAQMALRSKDPNTQVGAMLASPCRRKMVGGYNGFPPGIPDRTDVLARRAVHEYNLGKDDLVCHAEMNAILNCTERPAGWTMYVTHLPCVNCAKHIAAAGISRVVARSELTVTDMGQSRAADVFRLAGVEYDLVQPPE